MVPPALWAACMAYGCGIEDIRQKRCCLGWIPHPVGALRIPTETVL